FPQSQALKLVLASRSGSRSTSGKTEEPQAGSTQNQPDASTPAKNPSESNKTGSLEEELSQARAEMRKKSWLSARRHFINAYKLAPENMDFYPELAEACMKCNDPNGAIWVLEKLTQSWDGKRSIYFERLGEAFLIVGKTDRAIESFKD